MSTLSTLLGSRICHDLLNPLGAIGNGLELLTLSGHQAGPEMDLVTASVTHTLARVKLMRLAFGGACAEQTVGRAEVLETLDAAAHGGRLGYAWNVEGDAPRRDVRTALLAIMCLETALPVGGDIIVAREGARWSIEARHPRLNLDPALWRPISKGEAPENISPAQVHFALLPPMAAEAGRSLALTHGADWVKISF